MLVLKPEGTRKKNAITLLHLLLKEDGISRVELSRMTGLTKTTISAIIKGFKDSGIVEESNQVSTGNIGKSPIPLHIRADAVCTIGVHLSRQRVETLLMDAQMKIITSNIGEDYTRFGPEGIIDSLFTNINKIMEYAKKKEIEIGAIGIGIPGPLDAQTGVVKRPPKLKGWIDVPLGSIVQKEYGIPVWIENDANVCALAEKWLGGERNIHNFICILLNEGIGAGVIINDELYQGAYDFVGEIGHFLCYEQGQFQFLEDIAGVDVLLYLANSHGLSVKNLEKMAELVQQDNQIAKSIVEKVATWIGSAIVNAIHMIGPQTVFIGGKMIVLGEPLIQPIREIVSHYLFGEQTVNIQFSSISSNAVSSGAGIYAMVHWLEKKSSEI
ncbi:MAG: ROK family transcriptional regulator [Candidatus Atribacteria bacterium]|nr:MAG: ROK family transcriptional regulator [Candidatus Atribacteria bacterium]